MITLAAIIIAVVETIGIVVFALRRYIKRRNTIYTELTNNRLVIKALNEQIEDNKQTLINMFQENAEIKQKLLIEQGKFKFIEDENNTLRAEIHELKQNVNS